ncbi:CD59 glycoprotein-like [Xiphias gladius]|uniref:CD59 glycoprotein-like n=1 Tax=Xiphias gladius TaxID=8245 RepID=UPI001A99784B|nr:CD59 glycoprotein-like [Xiphias gladius]XP_039978450.1 CD59 glycoprotein-like [Xiphias gladius]XP_039978451.1 CD59 glycoprotein-like [Xiphias gladius]
MRRSVVFCLAVSFAVFGFGLSLQCYSCPDDSSDSCEVKQECNQGEDSCLKLTSGEKTYTGCMSHADCDFMTLAVRYSLFDFDFSCCQSKLCNGQEKSFFQRFREYFG